LSQLIKSTNKTLKERVKVKKMTDKKVAVLMSYVTALLPVALLIERKATEQKANGQKAITSLLSSIMNNSMINSVYAGGHHE
jgi:hypothetical protein